MEIEKIIWTKETYEQFINYLFNIRDEKYAIFHSKLLKNNTKIIGIKMPVLKNIVKKIIKTDYMKFIGFNNHEYYEEIIFHGLVVTSIDIEFEKSIKLFDEYIKYIESWASCDSIIGNYKLFQNNLEQGFIVVKKYLNSSDFWIVRVGVVLLLNYYINDEYIDKILNIVDDINTDEYYVKMAIAWLISMCLIKYYDKTYDYLLNSNLDNWTYNKALQKAIESYRIKNKEEIKKLKR